MLGVSADKVVTESVTGAGDKEDGTLEPGNLKRHTAEGENIDYNYPGAGWSWLIK